MRLRLQETHAGVKLGYPIPRKEIRDTREYLSLRVKYKPVREIDWSAETMSEVCDGLVQTDIGLWVENGGS